jgi:hypothetical protein
MTTKRLRKRIEQLEYRVDTEAIERAQKQGYYRPEKGYYRTLEFVHDDGR